MNIQCTKSAQFDAFQMKDLKILKDLLDMEDERNNDEIFLRQNKYTMDLLKKWKYDWNQTSTMVQYTLECCFVSD